MNDVNPTATGIHTQKQLVPLKKKKEKEKGNERSLRCDMNKMTHCSFLFKAPVDVLSLLLKLVAQLLLGPLLLLLQEAELSQLLPPEETTNPVLSTCDNIYAVQFQKPFETISK